MNWRFSPSPTSPQPHWWFFSFYWFLWYPTAAGAWSKPSFFVFLFFHCGRLIRGTVTGQEKKNGRWKDTVHSEGRHNAPHSLKRAWIGRISWANCKLTVDRNINTFFFHFKERLAVAWLFFVFLLFSTFSMKHVPFFPQVTLRGED